MLHPALTLLMTHDAGREINRRGEKGNIEVLRGWQHNDHLQLPALRP